MTKFMNRTFSVPVGDSESYRDNWEATFGKAPRKRAKDAPADTADGLLQEALAYVRAAIKVPDGPADELHKRIIAFLEDHRSSLLPEALLFLEECADALETSVPLNALPKRVRAFVKRAEGI